MVVNCIHHIDNREKKNDQQKISDAYRIWNVYLTIE